MEPTILDFIINAGNLVKTVMLLLFTASIASWTIIIYRWRFFQKIWRQLREFDKQFLDGKDLTKLYTTLQARKNRLWGIEKIFYAGLREFLWCRKREAIGEQLEEKPIASAQRAMQIIIDRELLTLRSGLPILATIGSVSPYVGLFGTVWGIMTSFRSLSGLQQATIAMVAPGISEALIATAIGLFAAIPAVIAYNRFAVAADQVVEWYSIYQAEIIKVLYQQRRGRQTNAA